MADAGPVFQGAAPSKPRRSKALFRTARLNLTRLLWAVFMFSIGAFPLAYGQAGTRGYDFDQTLQADYDAAQNFQSNGNVDEAANRYKTFLTRALDHLANDYATIHDYAEAGPLYEEALRLTAADPNTSLDYAEAALKAKDLPKARTLAQQTLNADPKNARAHRILGQVLLQMNDERQAKDELEAAVALDPNYENGYALASVDLAMKDRADAAQLFSEMQDGFGDSAKLHMDFGRAYGLAGYPDEAIVEFKKAIAEDDKLPGAHYSLGASYILSMGEINFPKAVAEFQRELQISPDDFLSYSQLGYIALSQHKFIEAEHNLTRAATLDPQDPDVFLSLGQLYTEMNKPVEAEAALRRSILLTKDPSRNHYQVQRAHYLLASLLLRSNRAEEGKHQMELSNALLQQSVLQNQGKPNGLPSRESLITSTSQQVAAGGTTNPDALKQVQAFRKQVGAALADSYNNLGVITASDRNFKDAVAYFRAASAWNSLLDGLDSNLGRAAYSAEEYSQAVPPLERYLQLHPGDANVRTTLAESFYHLQEYKSVVEMLRPIDATLISVPHLDCIYADSQIKAGDSEDGIVRLKNLEAADPRLAEVHRTIGEALSSNGDYQQGKAELAEAIALAPGDTRAQYNLALTLVSLKQNREASNILKKLAASNPKNPEVYYQLGKLELEQGNTQTATHSLEIAAKLSPSSGAIHRELAAAYRKDGKLRDAARESRLYEETRTTHPGGVSTKTPD